ncbi:NAD(P)-binding protein [Cadophora sp. DSE1049]|nr:NAD(P)-binding protein [Cadophora sp. DSE1049]
MAPFPSFTKTWHSSSYPAISSSRPELSLAGKSVVITGGGSGIGLAITGSVAKAGAAHIAILGRRVEVLAKAATAVHELVGNKTKVHTISTDVSNKEQVEKAFAQIRTEIGKPLDVLILNAGFYSGVRPLGTETVDEWQTVFNINILGPYLVSTAFIAAAAPNATVINISSAIAHLDPFPGFASYAATKLAGSKIMQYVQQENPEMHVVDVHPGQVRETEMAGKATGERYEGVSHIDDAELAGDFVLWATSKEARFLKGKFAWVNWDIEELKAAAKEIESPRVLTLGLGGFYPDRY